MAFPLLPVAGTAGLAALGYLLFGPTKATPATPGSPVVPPPIPSSTGPKVPPPGVNNLPNTPNPLPSISPVIPSTPLPIAPPVLPLPIAPKVDPSAATGTVTAPSGLNLRASPTVTAARLEGMVFGSKVKILNPTPIPALPADFTSATQGWLNVMSASGKTGFASAQFIKPDGSGPSPSPLPLPSIPGLPPAPSVLPALPNINPPAPLPIAPGALTGTVLGSPGANLRATPSTSGAILVGLFNGSTVTILNPIPTAPTDGAPQGWYNVQSPSGLTGFMSAQFVRVNGSSALPSLNLPAAPGLAALPTDPGAGSAAALASAASALGSAVPGASSFLPTGPAAALGSLFSTTAHGDFGYDHGKRRNRNTLRG